MKLRPNVRTSAPGKMYSVLSIIMSLLVFNNLSAQKKLSLEVNTGVYQSIGEDQLRIYETGGPLTVEYYSRKKFSHPYLSVLPNLNYAINSKISVGLQSGIYGHF